MENASYIIIYSLLSSGRSGMKRNGTWQRLVTGFTAFLESTQLPQHYILLVLLLQVLLLLDITKKNAKPDLNQVFSAKSEVKMLVLYQQSNSTDFSELCYFSTCIIALLLQNNTDVYPHLTHNNNNY